MKLRYQYNEYQYKLWVAVFTYLYVLLVRTLGLLPLIGECMMLTVALASDPLRMSGPRPFRLRGSYHHCEAIVDWMMN